MFGFLPHHLLTSHVGQDSSGLSPRIWSRVTGSIMAADGDKRLVLVGDDFATPKNASTYTILKSEVGYTSYIDTGATLLGLADEKGGVLALATDGTGANDEVWIEAGDGTSQLGQISDTAADAHLTAFECRFKISSLTDSDCSFFVGLATPGCAAQNTLADTSGAPAAAKSFIGFRNLLDGNSIDFFYQAISQTLTTVIDGCKVPVADTFVKLGFVYDPDASESKRITCYVDNEEQGTYVTKTAIATATFPDAEALTFLAGYKRPNASAAELAIDWWAFAQVIT